ncbi:MAG: hypothetical protein ABIP10_00480 [Ferruginibacter sp.]
MKRFISINICITFCIVSTITISLLLTSCRFNITDNPGPQISSNLESSKSHGAFLCEYKINGSRISGLKVKSIFAEKKYGLQTGFWGKFDINCCESQLVILFQDDNTMTTLNDNPENWEVVGFHLHDSKIIIKYYQGISLPDNIEIYIRSNVENKDSFEIITLNKLQ